MTTSTSSKWLALVALAAGLRLFHLGWASFQIDEAMSWLGAAGYPDVHPPLFYWLLALWSRLSESEAWLRGLPVLASLLSLLLCRRLGGWVFLLMLACSFADLQQAREVRMYAWLELWAVAHVVALLEKRWLLAGLTLLAASFTHLFGLFLIPIGWFVGNRRWLLAQAGVFGLWLCWGIPHYLGELDHPLSLRQVPSFSMGLEAVGRVVSGRVAPFGDVFSVVVGVLVLGWLAWRRPPCSAVIYAWALLPWASIWLVSRFTPLQLFEFKYLLWTVPAWALLLSSRRLAVIWVVVNLGGALPWLMDGGGAMADWRGVAQLLQSSVRPIYVHPSMMAAPLIYYGYGPPRLKPVDEWSQLIPGESMIWVTTPNHPFVASQGLMLGVGRYWSQTGVKDFPSSLPSSELKVSFWEWKKQAR